MSHSKLKATLCSACAIGILSTLLSLTAAAADSVPYPADWPPLAGMPDCKGVSGTYLDPNVTHWQHIDQQNGVVSKKGGTLEAAWRAFGFVDYELLRLNDQNVKTRDFSLSFDGNESLVIVYRVDERVVSTKTFAKQQWSCGKDGLNLVTLEKSGAIADKLPGKGVSKRIATVYRVGAYLYVKSTDTVNMRLLHLIPKKTLHVQWLRFPAIAS